MHKIKITLIKVDYVKLAERFLSNPFAKGIARLLPNQMTNTVAHQLVVRNQERFTMLINQSLEKSIPEVQVESLRFRDTERAVYDVVKLEIELKKIDYNAVIKRLLPGLLEGMSSQPGKAGQLGQLFLSSGEKPERMLTAALDILSQEEKEEWLVQLFQIYREDIIDGLNRTAEQQQISAEVAEVQLTLF